MSSNILLSRSSVLMKIKYFFTYYGLIVWEYLQPLPVSLRDNSSLSTFVKIASKSHQKEGIPLLNCIYPCNF